MKKDAFYSDIRHFDSPLAASVFNDDVPTDLFFKILDKANNEYRYLFHRYNHLKKEILGLDELYNYDLSGKKNIFSNMTYCCHSNSVCFCKRRLYEKRNYCRQIKHSFLRTLLRSVQLVFKRKVRGMCEE